MSHSHGHDFAQANKDHFNGNPERLENLPGIHDVTRDQAAIMRKAYPFDKESTTVMDFACGPGLISKHLVTYSKSVLGVDIAEKLVERYNARVKEEGYSPEAMKAVCAELKGVEGELGGAKFDVVVCTSAYHHFEDIAAITKMLAFFLKPGGRLLVFDFLAQGDITADEVNVEYGKHFEGAKIEDVVPHVSGFRMEDIGKVMESSGLVNFTFDDKAMSAEILGHNKEFFLATAMKPF